MTFPKDWPNGCPPDDSEDAAGEIFRIVAHNPPRVVDLLTHHETGRVPKGPPCLRCGLSIFRTLEDALHQQALFPRLGRFIGIGHLGAEHGKTKLTPGQQPTHTTWWVYETVADRVAVLTTIEEVP